MTGTDLNKLNICLDIVASQFSQYCGGDSKYKIEVVDILTESGELIRRTPLLEARNMTIDQRYLKKQTGIEMNTETVKICASKMGLSFVGAEEQKDIKENTIWTLSVPPTRPDIIHACDISEDLGIAYGYNNIIKQTPASVTFGSEIPLNKFTDLVRQEVALSGYTEILTMSLLSIEEAYDQLKHKPNHDEMVTIANPKTKDFQIIRPSLIPGLLKTLETNQMDGLLPLKIFEISDCSRLDPSTDVGAKNTRHFSCMYMDKKSAFEMVHGVLDLVMGKIGASFQKDYKIETSSDAMYLPMRGADIYLRNQKTNKFEVIGSMGAAHPDVILKFKLNYVVTMLEVDFEAVFRFFLDSK